MSATEDAAEVFNIVQAIRPIMVGKSPEVMGAVLADLLAMWLAGHVCVGDPAATKAMRKAMLKAHVVAVRSLIEPNYHLSVEPQLEAKMQ